MDENNNTFTLRLPCISRDRVCETVIEIARRDRHWNSRNGQYNIHHCHFSKTPPHPPPAAVKDLFIVIPLDGKLKYQDITKKNNGVVVLEPKSFSVKHFDIKLANINLLPEITKLLDANPLGWTVTAGIQLGTPRSRSGCANFVHVAMSPSKDPSDYSKDPVKYITKSPISLPSWNTIIDQWYIKVMMITIKQGTFGALFSKKEDDADRTKKGADAQPPARKKRRGESTELVEARERRIDVCSEFANAPDLCMTAGLPPFVKTVTFFKKGFNIFLGGFIPIELGVEIGGEFRVVVTVTFCLLSLKVTVTPTPSAVATVGVYAAIGVCFILCGGLKIEGRVADISFPMPITVKFKFPMSFGVSCDMVLIPLTIIVSGFVNAFNSEIFSIVIFEYAMASITKNVFKFITTQKDKTPPVFTGTCGVI